MKPTTFKTGRILLLLLFIAVTAGLVSWGSRQSPGHYNQNNNDTVPRKNADREKKIRDLDDVLDELNAVDMKVEMEKARKEMAEAMEKLDMSKIKMDMEKAMKELDMVKIQKEIEQAMAKVDMKKIKEEMELAMKEVDMVKVQKEIQESMSKIDWDKMKAELEKVKDVDMKKVQEEMENVKKKMEDLGPRLKEEMEKAKVEVEKAKAEIKEYKAFVDGLEKDGLIDRKKGYTLKHKDGELFINGSKASDQTYSKYRSFLEKHKKFNIEKEDDDFNIKMD